jgi:hypothetical protein
MLGDLDAQGIPKNHTEFLRENASEMPRVLTGCRLSSLVILGASTHGMIGGEVQRNLRNLRIRVIVT